MNRAVVGLGSLGSSFKSIASGSISHRNVPLVYASAFLSHFYLIMPVRILFLQQVLSNAQISIVTGWIFLSVVLFELPTGAFADLVGKKVSIMIGYLVMAASFIAYLLADSFVGFMIATTLVGLGEALDSGARGALVYDSLVEDGRESEFRKINGNVMSLVQVSFVVATFIGGWLATYDLRIPFAAESVFVLLAFFVMIFVKEPKIDTEKFTLRSYIRQNIDGAKHLFETRTLQLLVGLYVLVGGISWTFQRLLRDMILIDVGYEQLALGLINGSFRLFNILLLVKIIRSKRIVSRGWDILLLPVLMVLSYLAGVGLTPLTSLPIVAGIMIIGTGRFLIYHPYLHERLSSRYRATAMSTASLFVSLVLATNMFVLGWILEFVPIWQVMVAYGLVSLILVLPLSVEVRKRLLIKD